MAASALALQWTLDQSTAQALSTLKDVLHAATTDNVQPIALLAAEAFGATLPLSEQSRMIVEKAASRRDSSPVLEHLKIKIGWSKNDSATWLSRSDAGIRFLGLATTLLTTRQPLDAAFSLDQLIRDSAPQNAQLPTMGQLLDLLKAIIPKLSGIGFEDKVLGAAALVRAFQPKSIEQHGEIAWDRATCNMPAAGQIIALVDAVKRFGRICEVQQQHSGLTRITITTAQCFCWLYAFLHWMLGVPPSIFFAKSESKFVLDSHASVILVFDPSDPSLERHYLNEPVTIKIVIYESLTEPSQLWSDSGKPSEMAGGVSLAAFGQYVLCRSSTLWQTKPEDFFSILASLLMRLLNAPIWGPEVEDLTACRLWPGTYLGTAIVHVLQLVFGPLAAEAFRSIHDSKSQGSDISPSMIKETPGKSGEDESYLGRVSLLILTLACFDVVSLQTLKLSVSSTLFLSHDKDYLGNNFIGWLKNSNVFLSVTSVDLYRAALRFVAERDPTIDYHTLAVCEHGQVVYRAHLGSPRVQKNDPVMLSAAAGYIHYQGDTFRSVRSSNVETYHRKPRDSEIPNTENVSESSKLLWTVQRDNNHLSIAVGLTGPGGQIRMSNLPPCRLEEMFWLPACAHAPDAQTQLPKEGVEATFVHASQLAKMNSADVGPTLIVGVACNEAQRFFAFACATSLAGKAQKSKIRPFCIVFKGESCLACSLEICKRKGIKILIL